MPSAAAVVCPAIACRRASRRGRWLACALALSSLALALAILPGPGELAVRPLDAQGRDHSDRMPHPEDPSREIWFYRCNHRAPNELLPLIARYKSAKGEVIEYTENHTLLIADTPERMTLLARILRQADVPRAQVMIEVKVISLTYETDFQLGFENSWDLTNKGGNNSTFFRGWNLTFHPEDFIRSLNANPNDRGAAEDNFQGTTLKFRTVGPTETRLGSLDLTIRALQGTGRASIVARPSVLVESGYRASIEAGQEVPVQNQTIINNIPVVGIEYRTVGTTLSLTPHIIGPDHVELTVEPEVSSVSRFFDPGGSGLTNPLIQRQRANTHVILRSGETLEIGGLRSTRSLIQQTGIPLLMDIPIIGYLFRASRKELRRQDIVFFITPTILDDVPDTTAPAYTQAVTNDYESFFGNDLDAPAGGAGTPPNGGANGNGGTGNGNGGAGTGNGR